MSLQYYPLTLGTNEQQKRFDAQGKFIYYNTGTTPNITAGTVLASSRNQAIKVRPFGGGGHEIELVPGQFYKVGSHDKTPAAWLISNSNTAEAITGQLLIGDGEFGDNNTSNTIKLDATFANNVKVTNTVGERVPVTLDPTQVLTIAGATVNYTNSFANAALGVANETNVYQVFAPAVNVNGAYVEFAELASGCNSAYSQVTISLVAKVTAPAGMVDGDVLMMIVNQAGSLSESSNVNMTLGARVKIAAGKGLWAVQQGGSTAPTAAVKTVLYTIL
jgi:hypothetical protein